MKDETPCRRCKNHSPTCHAICKAYMEWRERHLVRKEKEQKARNLERIISEREQDAVERMMYHRHR